MVEQATYDHPGAAYDAHEQHEDHGNSVAAWTLVGLIMLGTFILCAGAIVWSKPLAIAGVVVMVLGLIAGRVLSVMGYGKGGVHTEEEFEKRHPHS